MFQAFQQRRWPLIILWVVIVAAIVAAPAVLPVFRLNLLGRFLSLAIVALGIDLIWGFTGLLSLVTIDIFVAFPNLIFDLEFDVVILFLVLYHEHWCFWLDDLRFSNLCGNVKKILDCH